jgi:hypothetical protein
MVLSFNLLVKIPNTFPLQIECNEKIAKPVGNIINLSIPAPSVTF